jgi:diaminohydroxyphosphoribosylaminopyrimidine deaminase/5-amino-6-(5-phosphoribosylamino)uracil reductase
MSDPSPSPLYDTLTVPTGAADGGFVLGRIAQSLDGRIAMANGESRWISGHPDIVHTHRLRALFDAVLVGAGTVRADDPELTTRHVLGASPMRVVLDPDRRLGAHHRVFLDGRPTLLVCASDLNGTDRHGGAEVVRVPRRPDGLDLRVLLAALQARGLQRVMVEGGGITVSRFLAAGAFDRLHVTIAPLLLGCGVPAFTLPPAAALADGLRFPWRVHHLGDDVLMDIPLTRTCLAA